MLSTILGEQVKQGWVAKIADDLYVGGFSNDNLLGRWSFVMNTLYENGLKLKAEKQTYFVAVIVLSFPF